MQLVERFQYPDTQRITQANGIRHYICPISGKHLPSVTTILDRTADKSFLIEWRQRVGEVEANRIKHEALGLGTLMHTHLDNYIHGQPRPGGNNLVRVMAEKMADTIIEHGLSKVAEVYGSEVVLYYPELFAGTCDTIAKVDDTLSVVDFKTTNKMRTRDMIEDYFCQLAGYSLAHDQMHSTNIDQGIIYMVSKDYEFKEFIIKGDELKDYQTKFIDRLERYLAVSA